MADDETYVEGDAVGLRRKSSSPSLRQRPLNRAATFAQGSQSYETARRRSSLLSLSSTARSSTDNLLRTQTQGVVRSGQSAASEELTHWHSLPLVFAILPAAAGLFFNDGSAIATDILLLGLSTVFLKWCLFVPWEWYHAAQSVQVFKPNWAETSTIFEEEDDVIEDDDDDQHEHSESPTGDPTSSTEAIPLSQEQLNAEAELRKKRLIALSLCFLGPVIGASLLHYIRAYLSRPSAGLVSNYNLVLFVLAAEIPPFSHVIQLQQGQITQLRRVVEQGAGSGIAMDKEEILSLVHRLDQVEARISTENGTTSRADAKATEISSNVRQSIQPQLDALNRAVRRYEKRSTTKEIQTEARLHDLEVRLRDALSLAASAARTGQQPGIIARVLHWISGLFAFVVNGVWAIVVYPWILLGQIMQILKSWVMPKNLIQGQKKRINGKVASAKSEHARVQARNPR